MLHQRGKRPSYEEVKENLEYQDNVLIPTIWVQLVGLMFVVFGVYVVFKVREDLLVDLAQNFSQLTMTVIIGFAALVFAVAVVEFKEHDKYRKQRLHSLIEWVVYFSIVNLFLFLVSYLPEGLIEFWIRFCFVISIVTLLVVLWKFFNLMQSLLK